MNICDACMSKLTRDRVYPPHFEVYGTMPRYTHAVCDACGQTDECVRRDDIVQPRNTPAETPK